MEMTCASQMSEDDPEACEGQYPDLREELIASAKVP